MAVVGIDLGTLASKIGVARHRGIDIIVNEVSNRATPSLVAFGPKQRALGEPAKTQETSNAKNTVGSLKRLVGIPSSSSPATQVEKKFLVNNTLVDLPGSGGVGVEVTFLGVKQSFSNVQLLAAYLGKLKTTASNELKQPVHDVVLSVPLWFSDRQRRAVLDAAQVVGLNVLRLINDTTASALGYGITKSDLPDVPEDDAPPPADGSEVPRKRNVLFLDIGHSSLQISLVQLWKSHLSVVASASNPHLGGRDIDIALVHHFANEFKGKYKIDVLSNAKATFRLLASAEKLKKVLSANAEGVLSVESIMNDVDASSKLTRDELEGLIAPLLQGVAQPIKEVLEATKEIVPPEQLDAIELIGGSTRIPAVRAAISSALAAAGVTKPLSTTLNQDEAVARGATFSCAMLSPVFRVREFHIADVLGGKKGIKFSWERAPTDSPSDDTELTVFSPTSRIPSTKILTFFRPANSSFEIDVNYEGGDEPTEYIGRVVIKDVGPAAPGAKDGLVCLKVKARLNTHSVLVVENAYVEETETVTAEEKADGMEVDGDAPALKKTKTKIVKKPLPVIFNSTNLSPEVVNQLKEQEAAIAAEDKLVTDTEDRKNALEEYVYDMRGKLDDRYATYAKAAEKSALLAGLQENEDWLYTEEGEESTKSVYVSRLDALKKIGDPIVKRWREHTLLLKPAISSLRETLDTYLAQASLDNPDANYAHITNEDKIKVIEKVVQTRQWLDDSYIRQQEKPKDVDPILTSEEVEKKRDEVIYFVTPILSKPKPKVTPQPTPGQGTPNPTGTPNPEKQEEKKKQESGGPSEMDVD